MCSESICTQMKNMTVYAVKCKMYGFLYFLKVYNKVIQYNCETQYKNVQ